MIHYPLTSQMYLNFFIDITLTVLGAGFIGNLVELFLGLTLHRKKLLHLTYNLASIDAKKKPLSVVVCRCFVVIFLGSGR